MQEQIDNGDLTARLDDARNLLRDRGLEPDVRVGVAPCAVSGDGSSENDEGAPADIAGRPRRGRAQDPVCPDFRSGQDLATRTG